MWDGFVLRPGKGSLRMKTILIVDDEPAARYALRRALESRYRMAEADSAAAARGLLTTDKPDLLLLDIGDVRFPIVWSIIGAALFVAVLGLLTRMGSGRP